MRVTQFRIRLVSGHAWLTCHPVEFLSCRQDADMHIQLYSNAYLSCIYTPSCSSSPLRSCRRATTAPMVGPGPDCCQRHYIIIYSCLAALQWRMSLTSVCFIHAAQQLLRQLTTMFLIGVLCPGEV